MRAFPFSKEAASLTLYSEYSAMLGSGTEEKLVAEIQGIRTDAEFEAVMSILVDDAAAEDPLLKRLIPDLEAAAVHLGGITVTGERDFSVRPGNDARSQLMSSVAQAVLALSQNHHRQGKNEVIIGGKYVLREFPSLRGSEAGQHVLARLGAKRLEEAEEAEVSAQLFR
jgi:hypothetical protein